jgi:hypothetical protein
MIVRVWQGAAPQAKAREHVNYICQQLLQCYLKEPGNRGALLLSRPRADLGILASVVLGVDICSRSSDRTLMARSRESSSIGLPSLRTMKLLSTTCRTKVRRWCFRKLPFRLSVRDRCVYCRGT